MGQLENALRDQAIPFFGQIAGYNRSDLSDIDVTQTSPIVAGASPTGGLGGLGDLFYLSNVGGAPVQNNLIRILRPQFVQVIAAYLTLSLTTANAETIPKFYVTVGTGFTTSTGLVPSTPTLADIIANHTLLKGDSNPWTTPNGLAGTITINKLNILGKIPARGDTNYRDDCFVIGVHFLQTPNNGTGYKLTKFEVNLSGVVINNA